MANTRIFKILLKDRPDVYIPAERFDLGEGAKSSATLWEGNRMVCFIQADALVGIVEEDALQKDQRNALLDQLGPAAKDNLAAIIDAVEEETSDRSLIEEIPAEVRAMILSAGKSASEGQERRGNGKKARKEPG